MGVVTPQRLNKSMGSPEWSADQIDAVTDVLNGLESNLENALFGAWITPRATAEVAPILDSGLVATRQPVHAITKIDGVVVDTEHPLAAPWTLERHRLRTASAGVSAFVLGPVTPLDPLPWGSARVGGTSSIGQVVLEYSGGWGDEPAIVLAILRKARNWALNWLDGSAHVRDATAEQDPMLSEIWTEAELKPLGTFRNLTMLRSRASRT